MSEAVCGPSNPLQQFKQHSQIDRSLQQDRLASRLNPGQGFRSADRNGGLLDAEFESFQAGAPIQDLPAFHQHDIRRSSPAPFAAPAVPSWASDFSRLNISAPAPVQQPFAPVSGGVDWAADFRQHLGQPIPRAQSSSPSPWAFQQRARYGMASSFENSYAQPAFAERPMSKGKSIAREEIDDAAFARAFDMVEQEHVQPVEEQVMEGPQEEDVFDTQESMEDIINKALKDSIFDPETVLGHVVPSADPSQLDEMDYNGAGLTEHMYQPEPMQEEPAREQERRAEDDALAATAGELLERVKDNQSDKFQNSQFLVLMRKLKDREVRVDGDKMVETSSISSSNAESTLRQPSSIPMHQQDADPFRSNPHPDGQDVVDMLAGQMAQGNDIVSGDGATAPEQRSDFSDDDNEQIDTEPRSRRSCRMGLPPNWRELQGLTPRPE